jgi:hypothetical protein
LHSDIRWWWCQQGRDPGPTADSLKPTSDLVLLTSGGNDFDFANYARLRILAGCSDTGTTAILDRLSSVTRE